MGDVFSGFFIGYLVFQIPAGWLGNRIGTRKALALMAFLWALAMMASAASNSFTPLYWSRVAMGAAQAGLFPVSIMAVRDWFPAGARGRASSAITSCMSVGSVIASGLTVRLLGPLGWRGTFQTFALVAVVWGFAFVIWFRDTPRVHPAVNDAERDLIRGEPTRDDEEMSQSSKTPSVPAALLAMSRSIGMWAFCVQAFFQAFGYAFLITWFPGYLEKGHGVSRTSAGDLMMLPLIATVMGSFLGGYVLDAVLARTGSKWLSRCGVAAGALTLCAAACLVATWASRPSVAVGIIAIGMFFGGLAKPTQWSTSIDLTGPLAAVGFAVMNMAGNLGAIACPKVVGRMMDGLSRGIGDWNSVLYLIAGIHLAAAISWLVVNPNKPAVGTGS